MCGVKLYEGLTAQQIAGWWVRGRRVCFRGGVCVSFLSRFSWFSFSLTLRSFIFLLHAIAFSFHSIAFPVLS